MGAATLYVLGGESDRQYLDDAEQSCPSGHLGAADACRWVRSAGR